MTEKKFSLSDEDVERIADAVKHSVEHPCRFNRIKPEELEHMFEFYENVNAALTESKNIFFKTLIRVLVVGLFALIGLGAYNKIKGISGSG